MLWVGIKSKTQFSSISHLMDNLTRINDPVEMANIFNNYFVNVGSQIDKTIPITKKSPTDYFKSKILESIFLAPVTPEEIKVIIHFLNVKKAIGPHNTSVSLTKILSRLISQPLSVVVSQSFEFEIFPDELKVGKVNHCMKKESSDNPSYCRPVSVLSMFSKIFEKLMYKSLYQFVYSFEIALIQVSV